VGRFLIRRLLFTVFVLCVDIAYAYVDPRVRFA
jgi:ABC-type dipeptide/oligopeptide/nickel transport system permease component